MLGTTWMNDLPILRTHMNSRHERARGHGLFWTGPEAHAGIYGSEGWGFESLRARLRHMPLTHPERGLRMDTRLIIKREPLRTMFSEMIIKNGHHLVFSCVPQTCILKQSVQITIKKNSAASRYRGSIVFSAPGSSTSPKPVIYNFQWQSHQMRSGFPRQ